MSKQQIIHIARLDSLEANERYIRTLCEARVLGSACSPFRFSCEKCADNRARPIAVLTFKNGRVHRKTIAKAEGRDE